MSEPLVSVKIVRLPLDIHRRAIEHQDTLRRELAFVAAADDPDSAPSRLRALSEELGGRFAAFTDAQVAELAQALASGAPSIDIEYQLPPQIVDGILAISAAVDEVDEFCRSGDLLTLVTPTDVLAYRTWFLDEFVRQARDGAAPTPWNDSAIDAASVRVRGDLDLEGAAGLRSELVRRMDSGQTTMVVDLSECTFLDSAGLSLLLTTRARCLDRDGSLRLVGVTTPVRRCLEIAGVVDLLIG